MVYLSALVLLPVGLLWSWRLGKGTANELDHLRHLLSTLPRRALIVADAFYQGYELYQALQAKGVSFLVRLSSKSRLYTAQGVRLERFRQGMFYYWPENAQDQGKPPLHLRLLGKVKLQSRTVALVHREAEGSLIALQLLLALATQTESRDGHLVILDDLESPRRILLRIRVAHSRRHHGTAAKSGAAPIRGVPGQLERVRSEDRQRLSPKVRQVWPRRKDHKPPKPPLILTMDEAFKMKLDKRLRLQSI